MALLINRDQFNTLSFNQKAQLVTHHARFVKCIHGPGTSALCRFTINNFGVEVSFKSDGKVVFVRSLDSMDDEPLNLDEFYRIHLN